MRVGDYVRTKNNGIKRISKIFNNATINKYGYEVGDYEYKIIRTDEIIKSSPNIIDLIEIGDYVNGVEVIGFEKDNDNKEYLQCGVGDYVVCTYYEEDIKSIVTHEQFESMEYKL